MLLLHPNEAVSIEALIDGLWGDEPPESAANALQVYVSGLRKAVGPERIATRAPGYELRLEGDSLDLARFEQLVESGRSALAANDPRAAAAQLRDALSL